jgi:hypothetical protein
MHKYIKLSLCERRVYIEYKPIECGADFKKSEKWNKTFRIFFALEKRTTRLLRSSLNSQPEKLTHRSRK